MFKLKLTPQQKNHFISTFVNSEIESLLKDGIIQRSFFVYNSPVHVVNKKNELMN